MKKIQLILLFLLCMLGIVSCQKKDNLLDIGYLRLGVNVSTSTIESRAYNPKQWAVQIVNAQGTVVKETSNMDDDSDFQGQMELPVGTYTIKVSSAGFDNNSGFDKPYYAGSKEVTIVKDTESTPIIICTLANVKVSVIFDDTFKNAFASAKVTVGAKSDTSIDELTFTMGEAEKYAYFPVTDLQAVVKVTNKSGKEYSQTNTFENVKAREHYILNYTVGDVGEGDFDVTIDNTSHTYNYTFNISTTPKTILVADAANAWSSFALFSGSATTKEGETLDASKMKFEYRLKDETEWIGVSAINDGDSRFSAKVIGLNPNTVYEYRMAYNNDEYNSDIKEFTTEPATLLINGGFEDWYARKNNGMFTTTTTWYASSEEYYNEHNGSFWDSSNPGTTTDAGAIVNINPTQGNTKIIHSGYGSKCSAELKSQYKVKFAAASLYVGEFGGLVQTKGAKINFGRPFDARPTQLHGFFQYAPQIVDNVGSNQPANSGIIKNQSSDVCSIYIALSKKVFTIDNTDVSTFINFEKDPDIIAYGELPITECVSTNGQWKEFAIDLKYKTLDKPSEFYLIIVVSASKYGDYFTGGDGSLMYLDDFELVYGDNPVIWNVN